VATLPPFSFSKIFYTNLMKVKKITKNNRIIANIYFYTDYGRQAAKDADKLLDTFMSQIFFNPKIGYAGFRTKKLLRKHLDFQIFGRKNKEGSKGSFSPFPFSERDILRVIKNTLPKCLIRLHSKSTWIFVFPTFNLFVKKKMKGVTGSSFWKNTILLFIHPKIKNWQNPLIYTFIHEFTHSIENKYFPISSSTTLLDNLIFEGRANNFVTSILTCKPCLGAKALNKTQCKKILRKLQEKNLLYSKSKKLYYSVFFEGKEYPLWTGYAIGYQIVKSFLRNNKGLTWEKILRLRPKEILKKSGF
jgi:uncharacterized protein YjaZ